MRELTTATLILLAGCGASTQPGPQAPERPRPETKSVASTAAAPLTWSPPQGQDVPGLSQLDADAWIPFDTALLASPRVMKQVTASPGVMLQHDKGQRRMLADPGTVLLRWQGVAFYATPDEASAAWAYFATGGAATMTKLRFHNFGDIAFEPRQLATRVDIDKLGDDAKLQLSTDQDGWLVQCFACKANEVIPVLLALGASAGAR